MAKAAPRKSAPSRRRPAKPDAPGFDAAFIDAVTKDFRAHGLAAITTVREEDPVTYVKLCASILSKSAGPESDALESMTDEQLIEHARQLAAALGVSPGAGAGGSAESESTE